MSNGGQLLDHHKVIKLIPDGQTVKVETDQGIFNSRKVIVTVGAWTNGLLEGIGLQLPLKVTKMHMLHQHI